MVQLAGVNLPSCTSADPPVVLLHGSFSTMAANFTTLVPALRGSGRCVYGLNYGRQGIDAVTGSARAAARLVRTVLRVTGAERVDVVGYSQGGLVLRTALRLDGLAPDVRVAVLIAVLPRNHVTAGRSGPVRRVPGLRRPGSRIAAAAPPGCRRRPGWCGALRGGVH